MRASHWPCSPGRTSTLTAERRVRRRRRAGRGHSEGTFAAAAARLFFRPRVFCVDPFGSGPPVWLRGGGVRVFVIYFIFFFIPSSHSRGKPRIQRKKKTPQNYTKRLPNYDRGHSNREWSAGTVSRAKSGRGVRRGDDDGMILYRFTRRRNNTSNNNTVKRLTTTIICRRPCENILPTTAQIVFFSLLFSFRLIPPGFLRSRFSPLFLPRYACKIRVRDDPSTAVSVDSRRPSLAPRGDNRIPRRIE